MWAGVWGLQPLLLFWDLYYDDKNVNIHLYCCRRSSYDWNLRPPRLNRIVLGLTPHWSQGLVEGVLTCLLCLRHPPTVCRHMGWVKVPVGVNVVHLCELYFWVVEGINTRLCEVQVLFVPLGTQILPGLDVTKMVKTCVEHLPA